MSFQFKNSARIALATTLVVTMFAMVTYLLLEPSVIRAVSDDFTVTQTITDEISLVVQDVTMVGSIQGLSGGYATGTGSMVVTTNDTDGYNMTLGFSSTTAMIALDYTTNQGYINNYSLTATTVPDYEWQEDGTSAEFGYTVSASSSPDLAQYFLDNGTNCNISGGSFTSNRCWMSPTTTAAADTIINRTSAASDGATTTLKFRVVVPNAPSPSLPADTYVATGTLTATNNP